MTGVPDLSPLVFDIETVGLGWDTLEPDIQEYLLGRARSDEERAAVPERLGLHPGTGRVVAIGLWRPDEDRGGVLVAVDGAGSAAAPEWRPFENGALIYRGTEVQILQEFWRYVSEAAGTLITFNGRGFDGPFLMLRSLILGVTPTRNLVPYRYSAREHCDLLDILTFHGVRPRDSLHFWCRRFGIPSPKGDMDGAGVEQAWREGRLDDIARYCLQDVRATAELYRRLQPLVAMVDRR